MNIVSLSKWTLGLLDFLALLSIYATMEIRIEAGLLVLAIFLTRTLRIRIPSRTTMVILVLSIFFAATVFAFKVRVYPILVAAHVGVVVHALLWLGKDELRDRVLRLSMGFINITLASALTADFYLFGSIFAFAILGSIYISLGFLESTFRSRVPEQLSKPLPDGYLKNMIYVSSAVFLISILLFPLIPRASWKRDEGSSYFYVGYNDTVDLTTSGQATMKQSGQVALRIFSQNPEKIEDPLAGIPLGMLRGQALDVFDGSRWLPRLTRHSADKKVAVTPSNLATAQFEVIREPHVKAVVFKPYRSRVIEVGTESGRSHYVYRVGKELGGYEFEEGPLPLDLMVPASVQSQALKDLAHKLFAVSHSNQDKVRDLGLYYRKGFTGTLEATQTSHNSLAILENFLLKGKRGSCELFAASAATMLRLGGVPARLVAGYRVLRASRGGMLTVLDNDAHAWVEYWEETRGWLPFDPTPKVYISPGVLDYLQESYWVAEGLWFRWFLNFRKDSQGVADTATPETGAGEPKASLRFQGLSGGSIWVFGGLLILIAVLALRTLFRALHLGELIKPGLSWTRRSLLLEFLRYQRVLKRLNRQTASVAVASTKARWEELYLRLRFGVPDPESFSARLKELRELRKALKSGNS